MAYGTTKKQYEKQMLAVKTDYLKTILPSRKWQSKLSQGLVFLVTLLVKKEIAPDRKYV